jgi:hypothetical protein
MNENKIINESVNRFKTLLEYSFYEDRDDVEDNTSDLLLGNQIEEDENLEADIDDIEGELGLSDDNTDDNTEEAPEEAPEDIEGLEAGEELGGELPEPEMELPAEPVEDEVELDVTELVNKSEEAVSASKEVDMKMGRLLDMVSKLEQKTNQMTAISNKIDSLENELEKRVPTENEKLELRSVDSAPFSMKLSDFWEKQEGIYDITNKDKEDEYVLKQSDIDGEYNEGQIKDSLTNNDYDEIDI